MPDLVLPQVRGLWSGSERASIKKPEPEAWGSYGPGPSHRLPGKQDFSRLGYCLLVIRFFPARIRVIRN